MSTERSIEEGLVLRKPQYILRKLVAIHQLDVPLLLHTMQKGGIGRKLRPLLRDGENILDYFVEIIWHANSTIELPAALWMHLVARESWDYVERFALRSIEEVSVLRKPYFSLWERAVIPCDDGSYEDEQVWHTYVKSGIGRRLRARLRGGENILDYYVVLRWHGNDRVELPAALWMHLVARESWDYVERFALQGLVKDE